MFIMRLLLFVILVIFIIGQIFFAVNENFFQNRYQKHVPDEPVRVENQLTYRFK